MCLKAPKGILRVVMPDKSTTPDPVELTRVFYETMDRDWDFDTLADFLPQTRSGIFRVASWGLRANHLICRHF
jgi:hypothetical protein